MRTLKNVLSGIVLYCTLSVNAQPSSIETPENLKNSSEQTVVVTERTITEKKKVYQIANTNTGPRKAAIFVENRAGPMFNEKINVLNDLLTSRITEKGFSVINREDAINALKTYSSTEVTAASATAVSAKVQTPAGQEVLSGAIGKASVAEVSATPLMIRADQALSDGSSALRLAQNLGADYLLVASITSFGTEKRAFDDGNLKTANIVYTLRVSYKVLDGIQAGSLVGDTVKTTKTIRFTENSQTEDSGIIDDLLDDVAMQVAENAGKKQSMISAASALPDFVNITVSCGMQDLANLPISVPDIRVLDDGSVVVSTNLLGVQVLDATVELDGIAVGSAPGQFKVRPGLSKLKITREGFKDWERTVNCTEGQKFNVALQMSVEGYERWKNNTTFLFGIETGKKLTGGTVDMMQGLAQALRQSGYRVDARSDVKANIEAKGKSLFDGATLKLFGK